jgi:hypothetical protein
MPLFPNVPNKPHLDRLYRALGEGMARIQHIEAGLYLVALGAMGGAHEECSAQFFKKTGIGGRLSFTDKRLRSALHPDVVTRDWVSVHGDVESIVAFRNAMAHFEVYHLNDADRMQASPPTAFSVIVAPHHMNAQARKLDRAPALSIETIESNNRHLIETAYALMYFVVDHFDAGLFLDKGLLPSVEHQLKGFRATPHWMRRP